jgi:hypothetical protein
MVLIPPAKCTLTNVPPERTGIKTGTTPAPLIEQHTESKDQLQLTYIDPASKSAEYTFDQRAS